MIGHIPFANPSAPPSHTPVQICLGCAEGDHDRVPLDEHCSCPCHGTARLNGGELR
jgi:hypothetical protein